MICPKCNIEMIMGIAIDPKFDHRAHYIMSVKPLSHDEVDIINVLKCPKCGHSDDGK
jgi:Zn-finger nucleic acid-binding protein